MIRVGVGGWTFEPWRGVFYPDKLPHARELEYAASRLTAIEINSTYYSLQKPASFAKWASQTPDGFKFAVKASRFCTNRKVLGEGGEAIARFCGQGFIELGDKLGPILWQFMATKRFDPDDLAAFLQLLPREVAGLPVRHALQPRHESFCCPEFVELARSAKVAIVYGESATYPGLADLTTDFVYARLERAREDLVEGYPEAELDGWAAAAQAWRGGQAPEGLPYAAERSLSEGGPREVYLFMINGAKVRAPAAAAALIKRLT